MLDVAAALSRLLDRVPVLDAVEVPLPDALGRVLAEPAAADRDFPPTDRSAMDGFAVRSADCAAPGATLAVAGEVRAGESADGIVLRPGEAARIFTGAVIPPGADAVVMVERTTEAGSGRVRVDERVDPGRNIRRRG